MSGALLCAAFALLAWPARRHVPGSGPLADRWADRWAGPTEWPLRPLRRPSGAPVAGLAAAAVAAALSTPLVAVLACAGAVAAVRGAVARAARAAEEGRLRLLAEVLGGLAADLRAGRPTAEAGAAAVASCRDPVAREALARALAGAEPLVPAPAGTGQWAEGVARVAAGVRLSDRTGCSLAAVACAVEDDLRSRLRLQAELRAATAAPRASALLLAGLPVLAFAMGSGIGADPWRVLTATPVGQVLLVMGVGLEAAGLAWTARLVRRAVP